MSNFQKYVGTDTRTYGQLDLTAVPGYVYDFGTLPVPGDGRWQANAGPATGVFDNTIVPGSPGSGQVSPTNQVWVYPGVFVDSSTLPLGNGTFAPGKGTGTIPAQVITGPTLPTLPSGTEYVWNKTDGAGTLLDIQTGVAA